METYQPGICNIGRKNRLLRLGFGGVLLIFTGVLWWLLVVIWHASPWYRLLLFIPLYGGFIGIYQAVFGFCVAHAAHRSYDMT